jgi:hypothetical protein
MLKKTKLFPPSMGIALNPSRMILIQRELMRGMG